MQVLHCNQRRMTDEGLQYLRRAHPVRQLLGIPAAQCQPGRQDITGPLLLCLCSLHVSACMMQALCNVCACDILPPVAGCRTCSLRFMPPDSDAAGASNFLASPTASAIAATAVL